MKKTKILLDASPWAGSGIDDPYSLLGALFDLSHLEYFKEILNEMMFHISTSKSISEKHAGTAITMYTAFHSLLRTSYILNRKKYKLVEPADEAKHLSLGSLTKHEYQNPFIVFENAFARHSLAEFDSSIYEILYFSMSSHADSPDYDLITPYIHLTKMLDASWLVYQRGIEKKNKSSQKKE